MSISVFNYKDYGQFMRMLLKSNKNSWGSVAKMAKAANCQSSQISRVLSGELHLTLDQAYGLTQFWNLHEDEKKYFMKLVEYARAGNKQYQEEIAKELQVLKKRNEELTNKTKLPPAGNLEKEIIFYSTWYWTAIHIATSIPEYQSVEAISTRLHLPEILVENCLSQLEKFGLVTYLNQKWVHASSGTHVNRHSPMVSVHHSNWRQKAVIDSQNFNHDGVHYTVVQSISKEDFEKIKHLLLKAIEDYNKISSPSKEEELICFTCDFFKV